MVTDNLLRLYIVHKSHTLCIYTLSLFILQAHSYHAKHEGGWTNISDLLIYERNNNSNVFINHKSISVILLFQRANVYVYITLIWLSSAHQNCVTISQNRCWVEVKEAHVTLPDPHNLNNFNNVYISE